MDSVLSLPLANFLGIKESANEDYILEIYYKSQIKNHFNSYHASSIFCFAEITGGAFLVKNFPEQRETTLPIVRRARIKYSAKPTQNTLYSKGSLLNTSVAEIITKLEQNGKTTFWIQIAVVDSSNHLVFRGTFEWFVSYKALMDLNS